MSVFQDVHGELRRTGQATSTRRLGRRPWLRTGALSWLCVSAMGMSLRGRTAVRMMKGEVR